VGLRGCSFAVPAGSVVGLVGPNGAGKTTLLSLTVGLLAPTEGHMAVFGETSRAHTTATLARVSYLAQDHPLYRGFSVADMFHFGRLMNPGWDQGLALARVEALGIPLRRKIKTLSGGQQAQVSLTMALAKRTPLLALDEPVASLDPVARLDFMRDVMAACADTGLTVVIASHVVSELERLCDWLIVLNGGRLQLAGPVDDLLAAHCMLTVPRQIPDAELPGTVIDRADSDRHSTVLVEADLARRVEVQRPQWLAEPAGPAGLRVPGAPGDRPCRGTTGRRETRPVRRRRAAAVPVSYRREGHHPAGPAHRQGNRPGHPRTLRGPGLRLGAARVHLPSRGVDPHAS
jgi:ABC-2 type transport system ATP-binding protein